MSPEQTGQMEEGAGQERRGGKFGEVGGDRTRGEIQGSSFALVKYYMY